MILTSHLLAGAAIGSRVHDWWAVAALSMASHYLLDAIPHSQYKVRFLKSKSSRKEVIIDLFKIAVDFASGFFFVAFIGIKSLNFPYMMFGMAMAVLPDFLQFLYYFQKNKLLEIFTQVHDYFAFEKNQIFAWQNALIPAKERVGEQGRMSVIWALTIAVTTTSAIVIFIT